MLKNLNLTLEKGKRYGFVGTTGCGKSTLLDVVMGLLIPTKGYLKIDDNIIDNHNHRSWQVILAHVPQAIFLTDGTISENIAFGVSSELIDFDRVRMAASKADLNHMVESLPEGYDTIVGERGLLKYVDCFTLNDIACKYNLEKVDFIKCDIEGAEAFIFEDEAFFSKFKPKILLETHIVEGKFCDDICIEKLSKYGYNHKTIEQNGLELPLIEFSV